MARRNLIWHIGPEDIGGVQLPRLLEADRSTDFHRFDVVEARDADLDLRRAHRETGRTRADVEGQWSRLESKVWHCKGTWILSTPAAHRADDAQRMLAFDGLRGIRVQVVVFRTPATAARVETVAGQWTQPLHPARLHVIDTDGSAVQAWRALFDVAGLPARDLPAGVDIVAAGSPAADVLARTIAELPGRPDVAMTAAALLAGDGETSGAAESDDGAVAAATRALSSAALELASAEQRIRELLADVDRLDRKRKKHKRRVQRLRKQLGEPSPGELEHVTVSG